jgi:hypothetical protein
MPTRASSAHDVIGAVNGMRKRNDSRTPPNRSRSVHDVRADYHGGPLTGVSAMTKEEARIRIELTIEQRKQIKEASGEDVTAIEFTAQELEDRIAPMIHFKVN